MDTELLQRQVMYVVGLPGGIRPGSFNESLIKSMFLADNSNQQKLDAGFPELMSIVRAYQTGRDIEKFPVIQEAVMGDR